MTDDKRSEELHRLGATSGELHQLREAALQAGADTAISASQAAEAEVELQQLMIDAHGGEAG